MMVFLFLSECMAFKKKNTIHFVYKHKKVGAFNYMTWDQIREISKEDFVEIGNHIIPDI